MTEPHPDELEIQRLVDGESTGAEAGRVQRHVEGCVACASRRDDLVAIGARIRRDAAERPLRPVWPHVRSELRGRVRFDLSFAFGAGLAITAGLVLGVALGVATGDASGSSAGAAGTVTGDSVTAETWTSWGSGFPDVYGLEGGEGEGS